MQISFNSFRVCVTPMGNKVGYVSVLRNRMSLNNKTVILNFKYLNLSPIGGSIKATPHS